MIDIRQSVNYANYLAKIGWQVEESAGIYYFVRKLPLIGSILKIQRPEEIRFKKIKELVQKYRAFIIIIEPKTELDAKFLKSVGYKIAKPYSPTKTLQLDLTVSKEKLFYNLKKDCKNALRKNNELGIMNYGGNKIEKFRGAWKNAVGLRRYIPPLSYLIALKTSFKKNCLMLLSEDKSSGAIILISDKVVSYWQAFTSREGRKSLAQYKTVWESLLTAKRLGARIFDFEGIFDPRFPNKSWLGFTHFKRSFGGYEVEYPGCYTKFRLPV